MTLHCCASPSKHWAYNPGRWKHRIDWSARNGLKRFIGVIVVVVAYLSRCKQVQDGLVVNFWISISRDGSLTSSGCSLQLSFAYVVWVSARHCSSSSWVKALLKHLGGKVGKNTVPDLHDIFVFGVFVQPFHPDMELWLVWQQPVVRLGWQCYIIRCSRHKGHPDLLVYSALKEWVSFWSIRPQSISQSFFTFSL